MERFGPKENVMSGEKNETNLSNCYIIDDFGYMDECYECYSLDLVTDREPQLFGILANGGKYLGKQVLLEASITALGTPAVVGIDQILESKLQRGMGAVLPPLVVDNNYAKKSMDPECFVASGFEKVLDTFEQNIKDGIEKGGSYAAYYRGELIVNLWGGLMDVDKKIPWRKDTLSAFFSSTKGACAVVMGHLVDRGLIKYTDKISIHWPEFAQNGKENVTIWQLMTHSSGLPQLDGEWSLKEYVEDYPRFEKRMAEQEPYWKPGSEFGYHGLTFALFLDALVRRVDPKKRPLFKYFDEEFAKPLGLDFQIGLPVDQFHRVAAVTILPEDHNYNMEEAIKEIYNRANKEYTQRSTAHKSPIEFQDLIIAMNNKDFRAIPCGSSHGSGTAESLAKLYGILANGGKYQGKQVLSQASITALETPAMVGIDQMLGVKLQRGMGTVLPLIVVDNNYDMPLHMFGHSGAGGQYAYGDSSAKLGVAYTSNFMSIDPASLDRFSPRFSSLINATYDCIGTLEGKPNTRKVYINYGQLEKDMEPMKNG